jgi:Raf kinase inhibitor-like YbhB/YbcL family protein
MKYFLSLSALSCTALAAAATYAAEPGQAGPTHVEPVKIEVEVSGLDGKGMIGRDYAYCIPKGKQPSVPEGRNISPEIHWGKGPEGTKSYVLVVVDTEVPTDFTDAGVKGKTIHKNQPRQLFFHGVLADIPPAVQRLSAGAFSKDGASPPFGRAALNDYPKFLKKTLDEATITAHSNYDGPCPPWNDEKVHQYHFQVYALDVDTLEGLSTPFTGADAVKAMGGHVLAEGEAVGGYTLNPDLMAKK